MFVSSWRSTRRSTSPTSPGWACRRLADDLDPHGSGGAFDLTHRGIDVVGVEIGHLDARDLAHLVAGHAPDGLALGRGRAELDSGGLAQEVGSRRRLEDERERAVLEDRDLGRDDLPGLVRGLLVVGLRELDDVDPVRAQRRPDGRGGRRLAGGQLQGQDDPDLLGHGGGSSFLELFDLEEVKLDWGLAAEDAHQHLDLVALGVDLVDRADELGEGTVGDPDALALGECHAVLRRLDAHVPEDLLDLGLVERDGLAPDARDVGAADEARDARRVADDEPAVGVEDHLDEDVSRVDLLLDGVTLALTDLDLVLHRDEHLEDLVLHAHRLDALLEVRLDLVLVSRVRVDHIPPLVGRPADAGDGLGHHAAPAISFTTWSKIESKNVMYSPTANEITNTRIVRLRVVSRVGHVTFFSSDHDSSMKRRIRLTRSWLP